MPVLHKPHNMGSPNKPEREIMKWKSKIFAISVRLIENDTVRACRVSH